MDTPSQTVIREDCILQVYSRNKTNILLITPNIVKIDKKLKSLFFHLLCSAKPPNKMKKSTRPISVGNILKYLLKYIKKTNKILN